eukprot:729886_1
MGCCGGNDDGQANEDVLQDLEAGNVDASEHDEVGDESKTHGFWKDNRVLMITLALVCIAIIAYKSFGSSSGQSGLWNGKLYVKTSAGAIIHLEVESGDLVSDVKEQIVEISRIPRNQLHLTFNGKALANPRTLAHYNIQEEQTIDLVRDLS